MTFIPDDLAQYQITTASVAINVRPTPSDSAFAFGASYTGALGLEVLGNGAAPVAVAGVNNLASIAANYSYSLALKTDGTVSAWGLNADGQLGDSTTTSRDVPAVLQGLNGVVAIAAGGDRKSVV